MPLREDGAKPRAFALRKGRSLGGPLNVPLNMGEASASFSVPHV